MKARKAKRDIIEEITARIEAALENGTAPWVRNWRTTGCGMPRNAVSGKLYRGINVPALWLSGFGSEFWLTYKQATDLGGNVRKGEKGTGIVFWKFGKEEKDDAGETVKNGWAMARAYTVFNLEQCDEVTLPKKLQEEIANREAQPELSAGERIAHCEEFIKSTGIEFRETGDQAFYMPSQDRVQVPPFAQFESADGFYGTAFHELTHATGSKSRLDRLNTARFGSTEYAKEELVAECGAAFLSAALGVNVEGIDHHASYLTCWLKALKDDRRFLVSAFSQAQKAADWLLGQSEEEVAEAA